MNKHLLEKAHRERLLDLASMAGWAEASEPDHRETLHSVLTVSGFDEFLKAIKGHHSANTPPHIPPTSTPNSHGNHCVIFVESTCILECNSGIQRVVRMMCRAASQIQVHLSIVKWCDAEARFVDLDATELSHLSKWNGPHFDGHTYPYRPFSTLPIRSAKESQKPIPIIIPEIPYIGFEEPNRTRSLINAARKLGLTTHVVFYDAIPLHREELKNEARAHEEYMRCILEADSILSISEKSRRDLIAFIAKNPHLTSVNKDLRIRTIHLPAESILTKRRTDCLVTNHHKKLILSVGSITKHKNQLTLVQAFNDYCKSNEKTDWKLILAGHLHPAVADGLTELLQANPQVRHLGGVSDDELTQLYSEAAFTVFPSIEEGFGLPILESLWFGKPCICANFGAMAEISSCYDAVVGVDTRNRHSIRSAIEQLINYPDKLYALSHSATQAPLTTWEDYINSCLSFCHEGFQDNALQKKPLISIIIPTRNNPDLVVGCVQSVIRATSDLEFEIIIVDDASDIPIQQSIEEQLDSYRVKIHRNNKNLRFAASCNAGARLASGQALLFLNDDTLASNGFLEAMASRLWSKESIGIVGAKLLYPDQTIQHAGVRITRSVDGASFAIDHLCRHAPASLPEANSAKELLAVTGACLLIKKSVYEELNGFDENYVMYYEDVDLCLRASQLGKLIYYEPEATVIHLESKSFCPQLTSVMSAAHGRFSSRWLELLPRESTQAPPPTTLNATPPADEQPKLSIAITTYNRAEWLRVNLRNIFFQHSVPDPTVEIIVCDNASTDHTQEVVSEFLNTRTDLRYFRNEQNVGMLGNLKVTASHAKGSYIWMIGDDDLICPKSVNRILKAIASHPGLPLIYLNFKYTREQDPRAADNLADFHERALPIAPISADRLARVSEICTVSENFFTAIYCIVFRADHARAAFSLDTSGRPFSSLASCVPTTLHVLKHMMDLSCFWIGEPQIVGNLNNSWTRFETIWILERMPEILELALRNGASRRDISNWYSHNFDGFKHYLNHYFHAAARPDFDLDEVRFFERVSIADNFHQLMLELYKTNKDVAERFLERN